MKKLCFSVLAVLFAGMTAMAQTPANNANATTAVPDTTIGVILVEPITMEVTNMLNDQMKTQQQELVKGWAVLEIAENQTDTIVSLELIPDDNNLDAIKLGLDETVLFKEGSAKLSPKADDVLSGLIQHLQNFPETNVTIVGYTSTTGGAQRNMDLSMDRAQSVMDYMVAQGVDPTRLKAIGKSWNNPIASNATAAGRAENRRVEVWVTVSQQMIDNAQQ